MKYGIVIFPSKDLQDYANSLRKRYDSKYALIVPHLTLKQSFESTDKEIQEISSILRNVAASHRPFQMEVTKVSSFQPVNNVIYLKVHPSEELCSLHEDINDQLPMAAPEYQFVPHITIGQDLSNDEHSDVFGQLRMTNVQRSEQVDRFHLLYQLDNEAWTVHETFRLDKGASNE
ncbi:YjcG family protein [Bacillus fonticola]|uniref:YjcG family protein n=1 Tax=Bacillus fonticola TaxID=2728853 RepID=UPI0014742EEC|nr:YjcG family protein [Bacillus fonticola]